LERSLSALLPFHNAQSTLAATVQKLLDILPELTGRFEVVVADDGSTDATIEVADELAMRYPQVVAVRRALRRGRVATIRTALDRSAGDVLLLEDEDSRVPLNELQRLWRALDHHEIVLGRPGPPPDSHGIVCREPPPARRGGLQLVSRRVIGPIVESLVDQATLVASLQAQGLAWHEVDMADPAWDWRPEQVSKPPHRLAQPKAGQARGPGRSGATSDTESGPRRPNYLRRLKDFALGE